MKIAELRERTAAQTDAKKYDFAARIKDIKDAEQRSKDEAKEAKRRKKEEDSAKAAAEANGPVDENMMAAMGFGGFGTTSKK